MAEDREPPPMQNEPDLFDDEEDDDIFKSTSSQPRLETSTQQQEVSLESEPEVDPTPEAEPDPAPGPELKDNSPPDLEPPSSSNDKKSPANVDDSGDDLFASVDDSSDVTPKKSAALFQSNVEEDTGPLSKKPSQAEVDENEEEEDKFNMEISVTNPMKIGDGMNAYMVYQVNTVTNVPVFKKGEFAVKRRFSDFLGLHDKLVGRHQSSGVIVPKAPEKSTMGMARVKMSKEESSSQDFVEKRRAALERYMNRTVAHKDLRMDPDLRDFLTMDADLPKASSTSALSAAGVLRQFGKVRDAVTKLSSTIQETDSWFDDKIQLIEAMEVQLKKLHDSSETLVVRRHAASQNLSTFAKAIAIVASTEEHTTLKQVMSKLADVEENVQQICDEQADSDFFTFSELLKDYLSQISAVKDVFGERVKIYKQWKDAEAMLNKKRDAKARLELAHKTDKIPPAEAECKEWESKVLKGEGDFDKISAALKKEMAGFDSKRCKDFKANLTNYLEKLLNNEEQLVKHWEAFLPEAKSIA